MRLTAGLEAENPLPQQAAQQQRRIQVGRQARCQGQADVADIPQHHQGKNKGQVHQHIGRHRDNTDLYRRFRVLARVEARRENFHQHKGDQAEAVGPQAEAGHLHIVRRQGTILKERDQDGFSEQD